MTLKKKNMLLGLALAVSLLLAGMLVLGMLANKAIARASRGLVYHDIDQVPTRRVGLVLGTGRTIQGRPNLYYQARLEAAASLYLLGKVKKILVSGDHGRRDYNETEAMITDLEVLGVKRTDIKGDHAGFRTLDSVVRAREIFKVEDPLVISQDWHCRRAIFLARGRGIDAIGFAAGDVRSGGARAFVMGREFLARCRAGLDLWVWDQQPRFLGKPEPIR